MAVAWTDITNAQVAAGAAVTTALMTALRDNPEGIAQRASGAPKIFGVPYDFQEFTTSGTWNKPSNAETGDEVLIQIVGGGASGERNGGNAPVDGGKGGAGFIFRFEIDRVPSTLSIGSVGAGASSTGAVVAGGDTVIGSNLDEFYFKAAGGPSSSRSAPNGVFHKDEDSEIFGIYGDQINDPQGIYGDSQLTGGGGGGAGSTGDADSGGCSFFGGGGGGGGYATTTSAMGGGGPSYMAGSGGNAVTISADDGEQDGHFPGGGGGGVEESAAAAAGSGADGVVRIWCIKNG